MLKNNRLLASHRGNQIVPDRLNRKDHPHYTRLVDKAITIYREGFGVKKTDLYDRIMSIFEKDPNCPTKRAMAFCSLFDSFSQFEEDAEGLSKRIRSEIFSFAASFHPVVSHNDLFYKENRTSLIKQIESKFGISLQEISRVLYRDVDGFQPLIDFHYKGDGESLLQLYNLAQIKALLRKCIKMRLELDGDPKAFLSITKENGFIFNCIRLGGGAYRFETSLKSSLHRSTREYRMLCNFIDRLITIEQWELSASIISPIDQSKKQFLLSSKTVNHPSLNTDYRSSAGSKNRFYMDPKHLNTKHGPLKEVNRLVLDDIYCFSPSYSISISNSETIYVDYLPQRATVEIGPYIQFLTRFNTSRILLFLKDKESKISKVENVTLVKYRSVLSEKRLIEILNRIL